MCAETSKIEPAVKNVGKHGTKKEKQNPCPLSFIAFFILYLMLSFPSSHTSPLPPFAPSTRPDGQAPVQAHDG